MTIISTQFAPFAGFVRALAAAPRRSESYTSTVLGNPSCPGHQDPRLPTARSAATTGAESAGQPHDPYGGAALTRYRPVPDSRAKDERQRRRRLRHGKPGGLPRLGPRRAASKTAAIVRGATQGRVWKGWASAGGWSCAQVPSPRRESTAGPALFGPGAGPVHPAPASRPVSRAAAGSRKGERGGGGGLRTGERVGGGLK